MLRLVKSFFILATLVKSQLYLQKYVALYEEMNTFESKSRIECGAGCKSCQGFEFQNGSCKSYNVFALGKQEENMLNKLIHIQKKRYEQIKNKLASSKYMKMG